MARSLEIPAVVACKTITEEVVEEEFAMKVIIVENYEEASQEAAKIFINQVKEKPNSILGLATGSTPVRMFELLREDHEKNHTSSKLYDLTSLYDV